MMMVTINQTGRQAAQQQRRLRQDQASLTAGFLQESDETVLLLLLMMMMMMMTTKTKTMTTMVVVVVVVEVVVLLVMMFVLVLVMIMTVQTAVNLEVSEHQLMCKITPFSQHLQVKMTDFEL